jgi:ATP-dependent Clp protease ATP-binding subunit ClpC
MFERFTQEAQQVLVGAQDEATGLRHDHIGTEHLLLSLLRDPDGGPARALAPLGISLETARRQVEDTVGRGGQPVSGIPFTPQAKAVLQSAVGECDRLHHDFVRPEHILSGVLREGSGMGADVAAALGGGLGGVRDQVNEFLGMPGDPSGAPAEPSGPGWLRRRKRG